MGESKTILALDIGTSKMQAFVGELVDSSRINVVGMGQSASRGVKKGDIIDLRAAAESAQVAIVNAEKAASVKLDTVCLGISGGHIKGFRNLGSANVSGSDSIVRKSDLDRAKDDAKTKTPADGRSYIHMISCGYRLDENQEFVKNPVGRKASRVYADFWMLHGDSEKIREAIQIVESLNLNVDNIAFSGIASGRMTTSPEQRENGVLAVDIGCGTTDYVFYKHGKALQAGVIPVAGEHLTNDLSFGLRISRKNAERIKKYKGKAVLSEEERKTEIWLTGDKQIGDRRIPMEAINKIISLRLEELFSILRSDLSEYFDEKCVKEIVLTGGTSKLKGICEFANYVLGVPCYPATFDNSVNKELKYPEYATALGLLNFESAEIAKESKEKKGFFNRIFGI